MSQLGKCTPLVMEVMGTSQAGNCGHRSCHISCETTPVQPADGVAMRGGVEGKHGHGETLLAIGRVAAPQGHQLLEIDSDRAAIFVEIVVHQAGIEQVDTRRNRRVRGEDVVGSRGLHRLVPRQAVILHQHSHALEGQKRGMPLVHVEHRRLQAQSLEGAHASDAQDDLLADARIGVAAIERIGDVPILGQQILRDIGVEQVKLHSPDFQLPHLNHYVAGGQLDGYLEFLVIRGARRRDGHGVEIVGGVALVLPSIRVQHLAEVALLIQQADAHQGQIEIAGRFQVVAGQDAQAAGIDGEALGQSVFGGEISDELAVGRGRNGGFDACVETLACHVVQRQVTRVSGQFVEQRLGGATQHQHGVVAALGPESRIHAPEDGADHGLPTPHEITGQLR